MADQMPLIVLEIAMHSGCKLKGIRESVVVATNKKIPHPLPLQDRTCQLPYCSSYAARMTRTPPKVYRSLGVSEDSFQLSEEQGQITHGHYDKTRPTYPVYY